MSDRFILFNDEQLDAMKVMMLQDLSRLLLKNSTTQVKIHKFPYYDALQNEVICSSFWSHRPEHIEKTGLKTDVLLATYGYFNMSPQIVNEILNNDEGFEHPKFYRQLFKLIEEMRILNIIENQRPRTSKMIKMRREIRLQYCQTQINVYRTKTMYTDLLFLNLEQAFLSENFYDVPFVHDDLSGILEHMYQYLPDFFNLQSSEDAMYLTQRIMFQVDQWLNEDMLNEYYHIPRKVYEVLNDYTLDDIKRMDAANVDGGTDESDEGETESVETKSADSETSGGAYLEMELHEGQNSDVLNNNDTAREGDSTDDMTNVSSKKGQGSNDVLDSEEGGSQYGRHPLLALNGINQYVDIRWHQPEIQPEHFEAYKQVQQSVQYETRDLIEIIKKTIDREYQDKRVNLMKGRLQKNLINWFVDDQYKVFYKKADLSQSFDATFTLLIDASASMYDKMDETIKGVVLFHETLKALNVRHEILAFNEDAFDADETHQPNIIDEIIQYHQSIYPSEAPRIMTLRPQDDNRDGVAIRIASERLLTRSEKQKFLIVFSDGEPSAFNYSQDGILDTYEAVENSRKLGIEIFNVFLSQDPITEATEQTIHNIYGAFAIFVEGVENLPSLLSPLLKKLLLKSF
ncbi:vWA domain-containing protein [Staphylococcus chromogenes]|uniref:vWA domain-containing protein n=1 Tax=Staphylococcus chromogenes TaxID=46126 RepID=UPI00288684DE|nr:VWA domain-containing protein [Staphylococcus chromogenes]MDT0692318.1 VWA domain-containing protein [Staphylococcus chromogenes]MDT0699892.1 VWA domain-containing protein [Staphylococcus chromogenes]MDU0450686.1 VWA domain-containing protein [Staphylococcus chromogenes]